ncbi:MAG: Abi family protein [Colwellia sp.]|jgi:hypothetical protein|nr:Abi family protein [Colwellia sp.]|tara:strand:+ start:724 stop:1644 length:921 start_codon:yes stop_codon:yes gene_type:complete
MSFQYNAIQKTVSHPRIRTYQNFFQGHTDHEIYGVYIWNKVLCGAIYPLLQSVEISLRNAINDAAVNEFGTYWHETINHMPRNNGTHDYNYTNLKSNFESARKNWLRKENKKRRSNNQQTLPHNHKPDFNCVVAETEFSTWEFSLHRCLYKLNGAGFLWPKITNDVFKNWSHQSSNNTRDQAFKLVSEIRPFRNRLSHHEPLWKGVNVTTETQALTFINKKIDAIEKLLLMICDERLAFIKSKKLITNARLLATPHQLDLYRERNKVKHLSLKSKTKIRKFINSLNEDSPSEVIELAGRKVSIKLV